MNAEQRQAIITEFERMANTLATLRDLIFTDVLQEGNGAIPQARLLFGSPVTGKIETGANVWGLDWFDAVGFNVEYGALKHRHTGADLNRPGYLDSGAPVYAAADGELVFSGIVKGWQGQVVVLKHTLEDGTFIWTRYAHIRDAYPPSTVKFNVGLNRGDLLGYIADYTPVGNKSGDHLHFDVCRIDLGAHPDDWPGVSALRVQTDYIDPAEWLVKRRA